MAPDFAHRRKCTLHARSRASEHRSCVRVLCAGYCRQRYSVFGTLPTTSPSANHRCQKSASTGHHPVGRRDCLDGSAYVGSVACAQSATASSIIQRSRYGEAAASSISAAVAAAASTLSPRVPSPVAGSTTPAPREPAAVASIITSASVASARIALRRYTPDALSAGISKNRPRAIASGSAHASFIHRVHRAIPGRSHPTSATRDVTPSHPGFASSALARATNALGGRRSSLSISPTSVPRARAYARFNALP
mmetsp:Transcript_3503/g.11899  ORF Transcript_3503/g.11899 Transcript_3503/m.11899 type:complete len:252 (-) Transcript_3503:179-934(-)